MSGYLLNVIHCPDTRRVMKKALDAGWEWVGYTKSGHVEIRWPATDQLLHCATTPSDANSWKLFARSVEKVSGVVVWQKGNRKRSRKKIAPSGFSLDRARSENAAFRRETAADIAGLLGERADLIAKSRTVVDACAQLRRRVPACDALPADWERIAEIERTLRETYHQRVDSFDPHALAPGSDVA